MTPPAAAATGGRTLPRTAAPRNPRRVSGPAPRPKHGASARGTAPRTGSARARGVAAPADPFIVRAIERTMRMADSRFLDRLIRGRLWIPLVAAGLMGIVFMQVSMLKLNAGIGRAVEASNTLERQNATMRAQVSGMEAGSKIDANAERLGMVAPSAQTTPSYVTAAGAAQAAAAAKHMTAPDPEAVARAKAAAAALQAATTQAQTQTQAPVVQTQTAAPAAQTPAQAPAAQTQTAATAQTQTAAPAAQAQPTQVAQAPAAQQTATAQTQAQQQPAAQPQQPQPQATATSTSSTSGGAVAPAVQ